jgi:hypothetical protein
MGQKERPSWDPPQAVKTAQDRVFESSLGGRAHEHVQRMTRRREARVMQVDLGTKAKESSDEQVGGLVLGLRHLSVSAGSMRIPPTNQSCRM